VSRQPQTSDAAILSQLIGLHYRQAPVLLDATWGGGRMWKACPYQPTTRFDSREMPGVDVVGTWDQMPDLFSRDAFQAVVWDPPHQTDGGAGALGGGWADAYGTAGAGVRGHANINHLYPGFLAAARAVLQPDVGTLLCKIADQTHNGVQHLQAVDFVLACRAAGWTVCEMVPKMRRPGPLDPKWRRQLHVRKAWSYWICAHPGPRCPAAGVDLVRVCPVCNETFHPKRKDMRVCRSAACRKRVQRRRHVPLHESAAQKRNETRTAA
jgi:hypothetical protein